MFSNSSVRRRLQCREQWSRSKKADIFGVLFLAVTTALGGGVIRDVLIGRIPPVMFVSYWYLLISVVAALAVFIDAYLRSENTSCIWTSLTQ